MKNLLGKEFVIGLTLVIFLINQNDAANTSRQSSRQSSSSSKSEDNDLNLQSMVDSIGRIPYGVGPPIRGSLNYLGEIIEELDKLTNSMISRTLGGTTPCVMSIEKGTECSGLSKNGGTYGVIKEVVNRIPNYMLPPIGKDLLFDVLKYFVDPYMDLLFGGEPPADI